MNSKPKIIQFGLMSIEGRQRLWVLTEDGKLFSRDPNKGFPWKEFGGPYDEPEQPTLETEFLPIEI